jgi:hypothetical protein
VSVKSVFLDFRARPYGAHKVDFGDEPAGRLHKDFDDLECAAAEGIRDAPQPEFSTTKVNIPIA